MKVLNPVFMPVNTTQKLSAHDLPFVHSLHVPPEQFDFRVPSIHPPTHIWRYSHFGPGLPSKNTSTLSLFPIRLFRPRIPTTCNASLWTSSHLVRVSPTDTVR